MLSSFLHATTVFCVCCLPLSLCTSALFTQLTWQRDQAFDDVLPATTIVTSSTPVTSLITCARGCLRERWCNTFFYSFVSRNCLHQQVVYQLPGTVTPVRGWRYYKLTSDGPVYFSDRLSNAQYRLDLKKNPKWWQSRANCQKRGEDLAILEPVIKADFVHRNLLANAEALQIDVDILIGAIRPKPRAPFPPRGPDFRWINGQPVNITATRRFWDSDSPAYCADCGFVVLAKWARFAWKESNTKANRHSLCERVLLDRN